jgi:hypothetical protein
MGDINPHTVFPLTIVANKLLQYVNVNEKSNIKESQAGFEPTYVIQRQ